MRATWPLSGLAPRLSLPATLPSALVLLPPRPTPPLVQFFAPWCGHCQQLKPAWTDLAKQLQGRVRVGAVDCTQHKQTCDEFQVQGERCGAPSGPPRRRCSPLPCTLWAGACAPTQPAHEGIAGPAAAPEATLAVGPWAHRMPAAGALWPARPRLRAACTRARMQRNQACARCPAAATDVPLMMAPPPHPNPLLLPPIGVQASPPSSSLGRTRIAQRWGPHDPRSPEPA